MSRLPINISGIEFNSPLFLAAGPLSGDAAVIRSAAGQPGMGAVITKTIMSKSYDTPRPCMAKIQDQLWNHEWQAYGVDEVIGQLADLQVEVPIIVNALGGTLEEILDLFQKLERTGPAMLELPIDLDFPEHPVELIRDLKRHLNTPLIVKVGSAFHDLPGLAKKLEEAGADCICAINSIGPGLLLDPTTGRPVFGSAQGYGHMTGPAIKPIALRCVAEIAGAVNIPVIGCGGISCGQDVIDMIRCGASAVSLHTAVIFNGFEIFEHILTELASLMKSAGCGSLDEIKGTSLQYLSDEPSYELRPAVVSDDRCTGCGICERICPYGAVSSPDPKAVRRVDKNSCQGCGLCVSACPVQAISLVINCRSTRYT